MRKILLITVAIFLSLIPLGWLAQRALFWDIVGNRLQQNGLYKTASGGQYDQIKYLLKHGSDPNVVGESGEAPLFAVFARAYEYKRDGFEKNLRLLLEYSSNPNVKNKRGTPLITLAVQHDDIVAVNLLLEHGADLNAVDEKGKKASDYALGASMKEVVKNAESR